MNYELKVTVHKDSLINYKGKKYSVPQRYIGKDISLKQIENELHIYFNTELIRIHQINSKNINYIPEDYRSLMSQTIRKEEDLDKIVSENLKILDTFLI